jgi:hypothetical protein
MSEISELLAELRNGSMDLEEVAVRFRERQWPTRDSASPRDGRDAFAAEECDPEPLLEGSFEEVHAAYMRHELTKDQYAVLAKAAAEAGQRRQG